MGEAYIIFQACLNIVGLRYDGTMGKLEK